MKARPSRIKSISYVRKGRFYMGETSDGSFGVAKQKSIEPGFQVALTDDSVVFVPESLLESAKTRA